MTFVTLVHDTVPLRRTIRDPIFKGISYSVCLVGFTVRSSAFVHYLVISLKDILDVYSFLLHFILDTFCHKILNQAVVELGQMTAVCLL